jgi:hypothetical protein
MKSYLWRYLDFAKFVHLIATKTLHFTRIDQFKDKFEGSYPVKNIKDWERKYPDVGDFKHYRKFACVSCWYESIHESAAMWEMYGKDGQGIAIRSTEERIRGSFDDDDLVFARVKYIDFLRRKARINIPYDAFLYKRIEFKSEREFRVAIFELPESPGIDGGFPRFGSPEKQDGFPESGENREVDLELLIDSIVLSPYSKRWYRDVITNVMARYHLEGLTVAESELGQDPVYPKQ